MTKIGMKRDPNQPRKGLKSKTPLRARTKLNHALRKSNGNAGDQPEAKIRKHKMKRTMISSYSPSKIAERQAEAPIRIELCKRAGATPVVRTVMCYSRGESTSFTKVEAELGTGTCECNLPDCKKTPRYFERLEPHERVFRSKGGKLSISNTIMVLRACHYKLQGNEIKWSKR